MISDNQKNFLKKLKINKILVLTTQLSLIILFITLWELGSKYNIINSFIFSSPSRIIDSIINLYNQNNLFIHIFTTLKEIIIAFSLGISLGLIFAIILYLNKFLAKVLDPFLTIINSLPKIALGPIIIIWMGANTKSIIFMALLINLIINTITIYNGFILTDKNKIALLKSFGASKYQILKNLVIKESYSIIISSLKINLSMSLIGIIMGEFLVSKAGLGYLIIYGKQIFNLDLVMAGITILLLLSFILYKLITYLENILINKKNSI